MNTYGSSPHYHVMSFPEWATKMLLGKINQSKFSSYYENIYEEHRHKFFNEPVVPGFQTYLHYESQVIAALLMVLNFSPLVKDIIDENSGEYEYLKKIM